MAGQRGCKAARQGSPPNTYEFACAGPRVKPRFPTSAGDELWLSRARSFAMDAAAQVECTRREHGRGRYTLRMDDLGTALYLWSCVEASAAIPTLD
jgi:hypothetical protein